MNRLKEELDQFWKWAGMTAIEYKTGINPVGKLGSKWTAEYLYWDELLEAIDQATIDLNTSWNNDLADLLVLSISLDNGKIFELCLEGIRDIDQLMSCCFQANQYNLRLKMSQRMMGLIGENED